jgi:hypothetical protein
MSEIAHISYLFPNAVSPFEIFWAEMTIYLSVCLSTYLPTHPRT